MTTLPLAQAKARFSELVREVESTHERVVVTRNGNPTVVIVALGDLEALEETVELARDVAAQERVSAARDDMDAGHVVDEDGLREAFASRQRRSPTS